MEKIADFIEKKHKIFFIIILGIAIFFNIYKIGEVPIGIHSDEASIRYDAYCIANYGVDRFCKKNSVYFINYGDGQNILYTYLAAICVKIFNSIDIAVIRIPAVVLSIIEVIVCYLLVKEFRSKKEALLFMLLVTISPWHIMKSRWALESYLLSPMLLFSIYALIKAVHENKKRLLKFFIAGTLFGITLYTYAISYIIIPIFLLLMLLYLIELKKIKVKEVIVFSIPLLILATPLVLMLMVQKGWIGEINSFITIPKLLDYREGDLNINNAFSNLLSLQRVLWCDALTYNSIRGYGTLYYFGTIAMIIGLAITTIKINKKSKDKPSEKNMDLDMIMLLIFASNILIAFLTDLNANRLNGIFISATYFELITLKYLYKNIKPVFMILLLTYILAFVMFIKTYFTEFKINNKVCWDRNAIKLMEYLQENFKEKEIYADHILYTYSLYANPISPYEFNKIKILEPSMGAGLKIWRYGNFNGRPILVKKCQKGNVYVTESYKMAQDILAIDDFTMEKFMDQYYILY